MQLIVLVKVHWQPFMEGEKRENTRQARGLQTPRLTLSLSTAQAAFSQDPLVHLKTT